MNYNAHWVPATNHHSSSTNSFKFLIPFYGYRNEDRSHPTAKLQSHSYAIHPSGLQYPWVELFVEHLSGTKLWVRHWGCRIPKELKGRGSWHPWGGGGGNTIYNVCFKWHARRIHLVLGVEGISKKLPNPTRWGPGRPSQRKWWQAEASGHMKKAMLGRVNHQSKAWQAKNLSL